MQSEYHTFCGAEPQYGFTSFAPRSTLLDPAAGFLRPDGSLLLRAACIALGSGGGSACSTPAGSP